MDASGNTAAGNDQNAAQSLSAAQQPIAHQVAQQNNGSNGVPQQPLASNSPAPLNNANIANNNGAQNGALNGSAGGSLQCEWVGCGQRAINAEQLYVRRFPSSSFSTFRTSTGQGLSQHHPLAETENRKEIERS